MKSSNKRTIFLNNNLITEKKIVFIGLNTYWIYAIEANRPYQCSSEIEKPEQGFGSSTKLKHTSSTVETVAVTVKTYGCSYGRNIPRAQSKHTSSTVEHRQNKPHARSILTLITIVIYREQSRNTPQAQSKHISSSVKHTSKSTIKIYTSTVAV